MRSGWMTGNLRFRAHCLTGEEWDTVAKPVLHLLDIEVGTSAAAAAGTSKLIESPSEIFSPSQIMVVPNGAICFSSDSCSGNIRIWEK